MTRIAPRRSVGIDGISPALNALLSRPFKRDDPAARILWRTFLADRSTPNFHRLIEFYLPLLKYAAAMLMKRHPERFNEGLDQYVSDGYIGLEYCVRNMEGCELDRFVRWAFTGIVRKIKNARDERTWAKRSIAPAERVLDGIRAQLTSQLGRLPQRDEIEAALRVRLRNPQIAIGCIGKPPKVMAPFSTIEPADGCPRQVEDKHAPDVARPVMDRETIRLAMKGLKPIDRKLLRAILRGESGASIGRRFGVSRERIRQRLNGLLWESRARADLAAYLGVKPEPKPAGKKSHWPNSHASPAALAG